MFKSFLVARGLWGALGLQHEDLKTNKLHKTNSLAFALGPCWRLRKGFPALWKICYDDLFYSDGDNARYHSSGPSLEHAALVKWPQRHGLPPDTQQSTGQETDIFLFQVL